MQDCISEWQNVDCRDAQRVLWTNKNVRFGTGLTLLRGDEGSGKTTALRLLAGEVEPTAGRVVSHSLRDAPGGLFWVDVRDPALDAQVARDWLNRLSERYPGWNAQALEQHLQGWGLLPHLDKPLYQHSTGTRRKVVMAAALASGAMLTLLDDPLAGLDLASVRYLAQALGTLAKNPGRAVIVAHYDAMQGVVWDQVVELSA